uniref:Uncharacterized protein n=1 Tax=Cacopsylla melanoneura TaxID=428564 RepID=A0A8D8Q5S9_9HEMI
MYKVIELPLWQKFSFSGQDSFWKILIEKIGIMFSLGGGFSFNLSSVIRACFTSTLALENYPSNEDQPLRNIQKYGQVVHPSDSIFSFFVFMNSSFSLSSYHYYQGLGRTHFSPQITSSLLHCCGQMI